MVRDRRVGPAAHARASNGGIDAFVASSGTRLLHAAYAMCGDWQHAEDLVQQVLEKVSGHWDRLTGDPLAYAYTCLTRANIDRWRRQRRRPELVTDPAELAPPPAADRTRTVDDRGDIVDALGGLPRRQRTIVVLRYLQDLSEADTAAVLGISTGAVKSGASRGLAALRERMGERMSERMDSTDREDLR